MKYTRVCLQSFGYELPPLELTSENIEQQLTPVYERLKLPHGRLELMSGIKSRRFWHENTRPSQAAALAGAKALANSDVNKDDIEAMFFTSVSRDMMEPASAAFVHRRLELAPECLIFDISNACLGFLNGMTSMANMIELGQIKAGLVVAGETAEGLLASTLAHMLSDKTLTRKSIKPLFASLTIGSGAVALVMTAKDFDDSGHYLVGGTSYAHTAYNDLCQGGQNAEQGLLMSTDSELLLTKGVETACRCWHNFLRKLDWQPDSINRFFCHQVGRVHASLLFARLGLDPGKNFETLPGLGNIGSVSVPITMALGIEEGKLLSGQRGAMLGIGSGINSMMLGIDW